MEEKDKQELQHTLNENNHQDLDSSEEQIDSQPRKRLRLENGENENTNINENENTTSVPLVAPPNSSSSSHHATNAPPPWLSSSSRSRPQSTTILEKSIFGPEPLDEFQRTIEDFILDVARGYSHIEVEAKLGIIIDKGTNRRLQLPVSCESILAPGFSADTRFESDMSRETHARFNQMLNRRNDQLVQENSQGKRPRESIIVYSHTYESDYQHNEGNRRVRVTKDSKTQQVINVIEKIQLGNLEVYSPRRLFDYRISVNAELPVEMPFSVPRGVRHKDRISYKHQIVKIDLTQVKKCQLGGGEQQPPETIGHELEIEFLNSDKLIQDAHARPPNASASNPFSDAVRIFLNNIRMLIRNAR